MHKKSRVWSAIFAVAVIVLLWSALSKPKTCSAAIVWQDDFSDGDFDGWTPDPGFTNEFAIIDGALEATGANPGWNFLWYPSDVAYGSWAFDVRPEDAPQEHSYVYIISGVGQNSPNYRLCVWTGAYGPWSTGPGVSLLKQNATVTVTIADWFTDDSFIGVWHEFNVTRDNTGLFTIRVDGTVRITVTNNEITTSTKFRFGAQDNSAIDNIVVSDLPATTSSPPPTIPGFPWAAFIIAIPLAIGLIMVRRRK